MRRRLDAELVRRGLARSREHASELIAAGAVAVGGAPARKAASQVLPGAAIVVGAADSGAAAFASRGAHKLVGALEAFAAAGSPPAVEGLVCLDAGASTGGFTDVLLRRGARLVHAVDVGYGQLAWRLSQDRRVQVHDRTNVRQLEAGDLDPAPELVVADLSFISLRTVLPALARVAAPAAEFLLMVKPQFEVGRAKLPSGGVVTDLAARAGAVAGVARSASALGLAVTGVARSPLPGPSGNVEFFLRLASAPAADDAAGGTAARPVPAGLSGAALAEAIEREVGQRPPGVGPVEADAASGTRAGGIGRKDGGTTPGVGPVEADAASGTRAGGIGRVMEAMAR
jgi:23S rRNA (cytidine1920-2'-O)/16S rRNA (cytidine1409-2'-O)-methyltransferase